MGKRIIYKHGEKVGSCVFIKDTGSAKGYRLALFKCQCGNLFTSTIHSVKKRNTRSCGCLEKKRVAELSALNKERAIHGDSKRGDIHYLYRTWMSIKRRCYNKNAVNYRFYGERGIKISNKWVNDYSRFKKYILKNLGDRSDGYSIDRINNNKNYEPGNLRWASAKTQANNRR